MQKNLEMCLIRTTVIEGCQHQVGVGDPPFSGLQPTTWGTFWFGGKIPWFYVKNIIIFC